MATNLRFGRTNRIFSFKEISVIKPEDKAEKKGKY
jgi:hypothetical protein